MAYKVLAINPGSTSTKIALYEDAREILSATLEHTPDDMKGFESVQAQFDMRRDAVLKFIEQSGCDVNTLSAVVGRGGMLPPVKSGAYRVNEAMIDCLKNKPAFEHASNLGAQIAYDIAERAGVTAYIYDSVRVDELKDVARLSGMPAIPRESSSHALNSRAMAMKCADRNGWRYDSKNFVVAHMGGGISITAHEKGKMVDVLADDEGPFSPERAGRVPCKQLVELCFSGQYSRSEVLKMMRAESGLKGYLETADARIVEKRIKAGDLEAERVYKAMAYQVAKGIGELATVLNGAVDAIVLTGGIAYSKQLTSWIEASVAYIAPVVVLPGENEMESLVLGTLRVLRGEEKASDYMA